MLAAVEAGVPVFEYTPAEIKRAVVGYGRAEKPQVQQMVKLLLGLAAVPVAARRGRRARRRDLPRARASFAGSRAASRHARRQSGATPATNRGHRAGAADRPAPA